MLPFEFIVVGTPVSVQTSNRALLRQWKGSIRSAAMAAWPTGVAPATVDCLLIAVYFFGSAPVLLDNDNFVKPVQDALIGLVYADDRQVTDTVVRRTDIRGAFYIGGQSEILLAAIRREAEFVYIRVDRAPDHGRLL